MNCFIQKQSQPDKPWCKKYYQKNPLSLYEIEHVKNDTQNHDSGPCEIPGDLKKTIINT
jgi:hypothetical protein